MKAGRSRANGIQNHKAETGTNRFRKEKNWKRADEIRDYLSDKGILLEDKPEGTLWRVKS